MGDHFTDRDEAQNLGKSSRQDRARSSPTARCRTTIRSSAASDAKPEIWSYGHRNAQGAAIHPVTGKLWEHEHGAAGRRRGQHSRDRQELRLAGDRLRRQLRAARQDRQRQSTRSPAWSSRSNTGCRRSRRPAWRSTRAICSRRGRAACSSARWPARCWCGSALDGDKVTGEERLLQGLRERIRDVRVGPDGALYLATDNNAGRILRVVPAK